MSDLAFNANGDTFEIPAAVTGWRVRRMKPRGAPELVYGRDGRPLTVPIECEMEDLRAAVGSLGRYRLDPVDDNGRVIEGVPAAYVQVVKPEKAVVEPSAPAPHGETESVLREALRANTELAKAVIDRFPEMMQAAAELLRAADGAGLPARMPRGNDTDDVDDDEDDELAPIVAPAGFDLNALVAQIVPVLVTGLMNGNVKLPGLAALFDWRKAQPGAQEPCAGSDGKRKKKRHADPTPGDTAKREAEEEPAVETGNEDSPASVSADLPPLDPAATAHFLAIQSALTAEEATLAREVAAQLNPAEVRAWFEELGKLDVAQAVDKIRKVVSGATVGGAS